MNITVYLFMFLCVVLAFVILAGKGDWLIAGYNTASKQGTRESKRQAP